MTSLTILDTPINGLKVVERAPRGDSRGSLTRLFCAEELSAAHWHKPVAQINQTLTQKKGLIRGMHFQHPPHVEMKLVTCLHGSIWDVAVDLRAGSPTFLKWHAEELSATNHRALLIPEGFAHGFQTLTNDCELIYLHSAPYTPAAEAGIHSQDPMLAISWPLPVTELSARDANHTILDYQFNGVSL
jgi:dTDP-4-dehydrorhamnose 3,5-epimerase